jgi:hypothetical protein
LGYLGVNEIIILNKEKGWGDEGWSHLTYDREKKRVVLKNIINLSVSQN